MVFLYISHAVGGIQPGDLSNNDGWGGDLRRRISVDNETKKRKMG